MAGLVFTRKTTVRDVAVLQALMARFAIGIGVQDIVKTKATAIQIS
jgi:hypothetical protein